ncbi:MAG: hypothetical protein MUE69_10565 [Myxococcota bacterium]|nr:hypothetical protein [Myxococcota bacterium]
MRARLERDRTTTATTPPHDAHADRRLIGLVVERSDRPALRGVFRSDFRRSFPRAGRFRFLFYDAAELFLVGLVRVLGRLRVGDERDVEGEEEQQEGRRADATRRVRRARGVPS